MHEDTMQTDRSSTRAADNRKAKRWGFHWQLNEATQGESSCLSIETLCVGAFVGGPIDAARAQNRLSGAPSWPPWGRSLPTWAPRWSSWASSWPFGVSSRPSWAPSWSFWEPNGVILVAKLAVLGAKHIVWGAKLAMLGAKLAVLDAKLAVSGSLVTQKPFRIPLETIF